jgi:hypothetical protein
LNKEKASKIGEYIFELTKKSDLSELSALLHREGGF